MTLRVVFMGTPEFSVPTLSEIVGAGHNVVAVYSQPPRQAGRGLAQRKSPVHAFSEQCGLSVLTPRSLRDDAAQEVFRRHEADVAVVVAYGLLLPKVILEAPKFGCLNLHASRLPRWRGAAPIQRAIMAGDTSTALMIMQMEEGLDTGPVCLAEEVPIATNTTAGELHDALSQRGGGLMVRALAALERGSLAATVQSEDGVTYAKKITKAESRIDFTADGQDVHNHIRGLSPFPGAWFEADRKKGQAERIKVLSSEFISGAHTEATSDQEVAPGTVMDDRLTIACGRNAVRLLRLQRAGKKAVQADEFLRGFPLKVGHVLTS